MLTKFISLSILILLINIFCVNGIVKVTPGTTFQYQLQGDIDTNVDVQVFFVDLFKARDDKVIPILKNKGKIVFCYFCAGSYENFRPDKDSFPQSVIAGKYSGYPDENWLNIRDFETTGLANIMRKRIDIAAEIGCDGVDPDNINVYQNNKDAGLDITDKEQIKFNKFLADYAHSKNLAIAMKNDGSQVKDLVDSFDVALNESCNEYNECEYLDEFIKQNKAAFGISYIDIFPEKLKDWATVCNAQKAKKYSWILKNSKLLAPLVNKCVNDSFDDISVESSSILSPFIIFMFIFIALI